MKKLLDLPDEAVKEIEKIQKELFLPTFASALKMLLSFGITYHSNRKGSNYFRDILIPNYEKPQLWYPQEANTHNTQQGKGYAVTG